MLDVAQLTDTIRGVLGLLVLVATGVLALWLWKETRRPTSLFSQTETTETSFDRLTDRAISVVRAGARSVKDDEGEDETVRRRPD